MIVDGDIGTEVPRWLHVMPRAYFLAWAWWRKEIGSGLSHMDRLYRRVPSGSPHDPLTGWDEPNLRLVTPGLVLV